MLQYDLYRFFVFSYFYLTCKTKLFFIDTWFTYISACSFVHVIPCLPLTWIACLVLCRGISGRRYCNSSSLDPQQARDNVTAETVICHLKPASINSTESSDGGKTQVVLKYFHQPTFLLYWQAEYILLTRITLASCHC